MWQQLAKYITHGILRIPPTLLGWIFRPGLWMGRVGFRGDACACTHRASEGLSADNPGDATWPPCPYPWPPCLLRLQGREVELGLEILRYRQESGQCRNCLLRIPVTYCISHMSVICVARFTYGWHSVKELYSLIFDLLNKPRSTFSFLNCSEEPTI